MARKCEVCGERPGQFGAGSMFVVCISLLALFAGSFVAYERYLHARAPVEAAQVKAQADRDKERLVTEREVAVARAAAEEKSKADTVSANAQSWHARKAQEETARLVNETAQVKLQNEASTKTALAKLDAEASSSRVWNERKTAEAAASKAKDDLEREKLALERSKYEAQTAEAKAKEQSRVDIYRICMDHGNDPALCSGQPVETVRCVPYGVLKARSPITVTASVTPAAATVQK